MVYMGLMSKDEIGKRLKHVREFELEMPQKELARLTNIPQTTLSKIERGKQDGSSDVALIAKHIGVCALWLSHGEGEKYLDAGCMRSTSLVEDICVYQYEDVRCEQGPYAGSENGAELPLLKFPAEVFNKNNMQRDKCFGHYASDSAVGMMGDSILVNSEELDPRNASGRTYAIRQGNALLIRNIHVSATGGYRLSCDNSDKNAYPDEHVLPENVADLDIAGRVRYVGGAR